MCARAASRGRRGTRRRAVACRPTGRPGGSRTSRSTTSVRAKVSLFSTYRVRTSFRSTASTARRGSAAAAITRRTAERGMRCAMPPTVTERYAVVSCHVERPLDDTRVGRVRRAAAAPAGRDPRRGADPATGPRGGRARRDDLARARARGGGPRASRPPHTLHEPDARAADRRRARRARRAGRRVAPRARPLPDALLRRRLVHGRGRRGGVRGARLRRRHAARRPAPRT